VSESYGRPLNVVTELADRRMVADQSGDLFRSLFERSGVCIAALDAAYRVLEANADLFHLLDRSAPDVTGREFTDLLHPGVRAGLRRQFAKLTEGRRGRFTEHVVALRSDGAVVAGNLTAVAVHAGSRGAATILIMITPTNSARSGRVVVDQSKVLTDVDARILEGVAAGVSTVQMASQLYLSRQGVEYHVSAMLRKLKAPNRPALVAKAYALGILSVASWPPRVLPDYVK
jgi:PAS domain S-box-containing protein